MKEDNFLQIVNDELAKQFPDKAIVFRLQNGPTEDSRTKGLEFSLPYGTETYYGFKIRCDVTDAIISVWAIIPYKLKMFEYPEDIVK